MTAAAGATEVEASTMGVRAIGAWLRDLLVGMPADEADGLFGRLELAMHEICMNSVDHADLGAGASLALGGTYDDDRVRVTVEDGGRPFVASLVCPPLPGVPQIRGYGLLIVRRLVDQLDYQRVDDRNRWTLVIDRRHAGSA